MRVFICISRGCRLLPPSLFLAPGMCHGFCPTQQTGESDSPHHRIYRMYGIQKRTTQSPTVAQGTLCPPPRRPSLALSLLLTRSLSLSLYAHLFHSTYQTYAYDFTTPTTLWTTLEILIANRSFISSDSLFILRLFTGQRNGQRAGEPVRRRIATIINNRSTVFVDWHDD